jgi:DNA-binding beta-propeller fold protein YncE
VLTAQGSELDAYATTRPFVTQTVVPSPLASRDGVDVSGQICVDPTDRNRFVAVDRTGAADGRIGWGVFELSGSALGKLSATETGRLVPTFQPSVDGPAPFGCGFLPDGRLLTTDVGNRSSGTPNGQLIEWFPPFDRDTVASCKVDVTLAAPHGVLVHGDAVYVAESRGRGVTSFITFSLPTAAGASGGCDRRDSTRARLASGVVHNPLLQNPSAHALSNPAAIAPAHNGNLYVSYPRTGTIAEITPGGAFVRQVLAPPAGAALGKRPFPTGTPMGIAVDPTGTLYYADAGLIVRNAQVVAGLRTGTIRRIAFVGGDPRPPEVVDSGLQAPDGIEIWLPR